MKTTSHPSPLDWNKSQCVWVTVPQWSFLSQTPAFSWGMPLLALLVATFRTDLPRKRGVKRWCYIRLFPAAKVVLHVSDHSAPKSRARERETSWMRFFGCVTTKCRNVLPGMMSGINVYWTFKNVCPFLESRKTTLWGHSSQMYILYWH